jgi:hypothetical protein
MVTATLTPSVVAQIAAWIAVMVMNPLDVVRCRLYNQPLDAQGKGTLYSGVGGGAPFRAPRPGSGAAAAPEVRAGHRPVRRLREDMRERRRAGVLEGRARPLLPLRSDPPPSPPPAHTRPPACCRLTAAPAGRGQAHTRPCPSFSLASCTRSRGSAPSGSSTSRSDVSCGV